MIIIIIILAWFEERNQNAWGQALAWFLLVVAVFALPGWLPIRVLGRAYPLLLLLGLFTLINAPFDWFALGLTRWLLRTGQRMGKLWPFLLGLADIFASLALMAVLALALVAATRGYESLALDAGAKPSPRLAEELASLSDPAQRGAVKHWWIYGMLLVTQLFSFINVVLGALTLLRGVPVINGWVHQRLSGGAISLKTRLICAATLSAQSLTAITLAFGCYWFLIYVFFGHYGLFGAWLLDAAKWVAGV